MDEAKAAGKVQRPALQRLPLRYRVERETADAAWDFCAANGITGVRINQDSKRWYPQGELLASVLGFNVDNAGSAGLNTTTFTGQNWRR